MNEKMREELDRIRRERKTLIKDAVLILAGAAIIAAMLIAWNGQITGYSVLNTFEAEPFVYGSSEDNSLSFDPIPNFVASVGEEIRFKVRANKDDVDFSDNSRFFEITRDGIVEFTPSADEVGRHNVWIIITDEDGRYYYQNVVIIIEE